MQACTDHVYSHPVDCLRFDCAVTRPQLARVALGVATSVLVIGLVAAAWKFTPLQAVAIGSLCVFASTITIGVTRKGRLDDAHEHKHNDDDLLKAGALQRAIFNSANFSSIATDAKGVIQIFNVGAERMLGYLAGEVVDKVTPADISDSQELIARATTLTIEFATPIAPGFEALVFKAARGIEDIYELTYVRKDGSRLSAVVSVTALRDVHEEIIGYLLIGTDNTARLQVEADQKLLDQRLRDQQFYTRSLIESNVDALMATDPTGVISDVNKQMEALTGNTRDELIGAPFKRFFTDSARAEAGIKQVLRDHKVSNYELTARAHDGTLTVVSCNATTFHNRDRVLQGVIVAARDVTAVKHFELQLHQKNHELEIASRMKSEFLANMSHELRTPLNAIIGFSEVLRDGLAGAMPNEQHNFVADIHNAGTHLLSLINDILDLSKIEAGKMTLDTEPAALASLFANSFSIIREKAAQRQLTLVLENADQTSIVHVDVRKIKQIVYNLLSNAVKFTTSGTVTMRAQRVNRAAVGELVGPTPGRSLPLAASDATEFLQISVEDTGIGISPAGMASLFKPFSQIDSSLAREFDGTGLGLAMVKLLAELHGGTVAVQSTVGHGSTFTVWVPVGTAAAPAEPVVADAAPPIVARVGLPLALVIDADPTAAELIRVQLEAEGFDVLNATTADMALDIIEHRSLSLITLDLILPYTDGWALLRHIKTHAHGTLVPIFVISIIDNRRKGLTLGASAVLRKPLTRPDLQDALRRVGLLAPTILPTLDVLVVDDDPTALALLTLQLRHLNMRVSQASSGRQAIDMTRSQMPGLLVLDLMMPVVSGFDVVATLAADPATTHVPILIVTAKSITMADRLRLDGHVSSVLEKGSFSAATFAFEVKRALQPGPLATLRN